MRDITSKHLRRLQNAPGSKIILTNLLERFRASSRWFLQLRDSRRAGFLVRVDGSELWGLFCGTNAQQLVVADLSAALQLVS